MTSFKSAALAIALSVLSFGALAQVPPWSPIGIVGEVPGGYFMRGAAAGSDNVSFLSYPVPSTCAGKAVMLSAEFRVTEPIAGGTKSYHGVHFDYEMRAGGQTSWAPDWEEDPSTDWKSVTRTWGFPTNMARAVIRVGLQGVNGRMEVRNLRIVGC